MNATSKPVLRRIASATASVAVALGLATVPVTGPAHAHHDTISEICGANYREHRTAPIKRADGTRLGRLVVGRVPGTNRFCAAAIRRTHAAEKYMKVELFDGPWVASHPNNDALRGYRYAGPVYLRTQDEIYARGRIGGFFTQIEYSQYRDYCDWRGYRVGNGDDLLHYGFCR